MNFFRWVFRFGGNDDDDDDAPMIQARDTTTSLIGRLTRERMILQARVDSLERDAMEAKRRRRPEQAREMMKRRRLLINQLESIEKRLLNIESASMEISALETNRDMVAGMEQINEAAAALQRDGQLSMERLDRVTDAWEETQEYSRAVSDRLTSPDLFINPDDEHYASMMGADDDALLDELDALIELDEGENQEVKKPRAKEVIHSSPPPPTQVVEEQPAQPRRVLALEAELVN